jgi:hypothetical protein
VADNKLNFTLKHISRFIKPSSTYLISSEHLHAKWLFLIKLDYVGESKYALHDGINILNVQYILSSVL